jgi:hypothetical protein
MVYVEPPDIHDDKAFCLLGYNDGLSGESHRSTWCIPEGVLCNHSFERIFLFFENTIFLV